MRGDIFAHRAVEGPVVDDRTSGLPASCCCWRGAWRGGCGGGAGGGGGGSRARSAAGRVAQRGGPAPALGFFPVPGRTSLFAFLQVAYH
jgi:hypothetical protein